MLNSFELIFSTGCYLGSSVATPRGPTRLFSTTSRAFHACSGLNISGACNKHRSIANQSKYGPFLLCIKFPRPWPAPPLHQDTQTLPASARGRATKRKSCLVFGYRSRKTYFDHITNPIDQAFLVKLFCFLRFYELRIRFGP